jgi:SAM-dependent methyltransferase
MRYKSETSKVRHLVVPFLRGSVLDVGSGGDRVGRLAKSCDLPTPYADTGDDPVDLPCDILDGIPVASDAFDTVYSSHLIEDFEDTTAILREFVRILKDGGRLILVFPDEEAYRKHCRKTGQKLNQRHVHTDMGFEFMKTKMAEEFGGGCKLLYHSNCEVDYNVVMVYRITGQRAS